MQRATQGGAPSTWGVVVQGLSPLVPPPSGGVGTLTLRSSVQRWAEDTCSSRDGPKGGRTAVNLPLVSATGQQCLSSRGAGSRAFAEDGGRSGLQGLCRGRGGEAGSRASAEDGAGAGVQESRGHGRHRQSDSRGKKSSQQRAQRAQTAGARRAWGTAAQGSRRGGGGGSTVLEQRHGGGGAEPSQRDPEVIPEPPTPPRGGEQGANLLIPGQTLGELVKKQLEGSVGGERRQRGTDEPVWGLS